MESPGGIQDVMLVCRNGHVITDLLQTYPDRALAHCERCGATTMDRCPTCGQRFLGATLVPGMSTLGTMPAPQCCAFCGAAFPWAVRQQPAPRSAPLAELETFLRRLPRTIRQLRTRHADRPPFRVQDELDLEDLLRAVLPLQFDAVRQESRTPSYASATRIDFRLGEEGETLPIALTCKIARRGGRESSPEEQWPEDIAYYERVRGCESLVGFVYDPEGLIRAPADRETACSNSCAALQLRWVIAT